MSIRLDWEIEAEQEHLHGASEDPETKRRRRRAQIRFLLLILFLLAVIGGIITAITVRLRYVDWQVEQLLRDTVDAEIATLRIGDENAFLTMQRSATDAWMQYQRATFADYQAIKSLPNTSLGGEIQAVSIEGTRGRVQIREIINGVAYERAWFYWRYDDGWRHVPMDVTFWGQQQTLRGDAVTVTYYQLDQSVATMVRDRIDAWVRISCGIMPCSTTPTITVEILPDDQLTLGWVDASSWTLRMPSPYLDRVRVDMPFDSDMQLDVANALAERIFTISANGDSMLYPADAYYLRQGVISWLAGRLTGAQTNSFLVESIARNYGEFTIGRLVSELQPDSNLSILASVTGAPSIDQANLDWRDVLTWRLALEGQLIDRRAEAEFLTLYDTTDLTVRDLAYTRLSNGVRSDGWVVTELQHDRDQANVPLLRATVDASGIAHEVIFRLVDGVWKRAN